MTDPNDPGAYPPPPYGAPPAQPYGAMPPPQQPYEYGRPLAPVGPPPPSVVTAFRLMIVVAVLEVVGIVVTISSKSSLRDAIVRKFPNYTPQQINDAVNGAIAFLTVVEVIVLVLYVLLAFQVRKGKQWARVVTWVIAGLSVLFALASLGQTTTGGARVVNVIAGVVDLGIIVLLAQQASNAYFRRRAYPA